MGSAGTAAPPETSPAHRGYWLTTLLVFASFALFGTERTPIPSVNEPHYLCKAKNLWDPAWCQRDLFLQSTNAHAVFLTGIGSLTRFCTLEQTAMAGRILAWLLLAYGWTRLVSQLVPYRGAAVGVCWVYFGLNVLGSFSGEWMVGGVEAKVFSYAFLFLALANACSTNWNSAAITAGLSISLHPVVGIWGAVAGAFALTWSFVRDRSGSGRSRSDAPLPSKPLVWQVLVPSLLLILFSLPGLIPAVSMLLQSPSPEIAKAADQIQVFSRLDHHLNPRSFSAGAYLRYGILLGAWLALWKAAGLLPGRIFFFRWMIGTILVAAAGLAIGWGPVSASLLKFYPFRMFDALLPMAVAMLVFSASMRVIQAVTRNSHPRARRVGLSAVWLASLAGFCVAVSAHTVDRDPSRLSPQHSANWIEACHWIDSHLEPDALFLTPRFNFGFKWYAKRAEYVAYKDCPQDAASLVEWKRRLDLVHHWRKAHFEKGFDDRAVAELEDQTKVDYIVAWAPEWKVDPYRQKPIFSNGSFAVYRVEPGKQRIQSDAR